MGNKILIVSGIAFWLLAAVFIAGKTGLLRKIQQQSRRIITKEICDAKNGEYKIGQTGIGHCFKIPGDSEKLCTKSSECETGYCVTREAKATEGKCFHSNAYDPCIYAYWTIEESQTKKTPEETLDGKAIIHLPCAY